MTQFSYSAITFEGGGGGGVVTGRREASDERSLRESLRGEGLIAIEVRPVRLVDVLRHQVSAERIRKSDSVWFFETLAMLLENKVPIESAMRTMEELSPKPRAARVCGRVRESLRGGSSLADAVAEFPTLASAQHVALLKSGAASGRLGHIVKLIDESLKNEARIRRTVVARLIYPAILLIVAVIAIWYLSASVIPQFVETLTSLDAELPWQTAFTLVGARWLAWIIPVGALALGAVWFWRGVWLTPEMRARLSRAVLKTPVVGTLVWHQQGAVIADILATMLEGGADVLAGLEQAEAVVGSPELASRVGATRRDVREGAELGEAMARHGVLPPMTVAVVRAGMAGGELVGSLRRATTMCIERQEALSERLLTLLEPGIICIAAVFVAWVVYSLVAGMMAITTAGGL